MRAPSEVITQCLSIQPCESKGCQAYVLTNMSLPVCVAPLVYVSPSVYVSLSVGVALRRGYDVTSIPGSPRPFGVMLDVSGKDGTP